MIRVFPLILNFKGAMTLEIDQEYFKYNIVDDGSYTLAASDGVYTKTITADNLSFSNDDNGK